jgi:hypothetical protein
MKTQTVSILLAVLSSGNSWAQTHPGALFGARDPAVCSARKAPAKGAPTVEQAKAYFRCDTELLNGILYLVTDVKIEVAPSARPFNILTDTTGIIDPKQPVYNIRGSFTKFNCMNPAAGSGWPPPDGQWPIGKNCSRTDILNATGMCYKDSFTDWHCVMNGLGAPGPINQPAPR